MLRLLSLVAAFLLGGCAVFDPYVSSHEITKRLAEDRRSVTPQTPVTPQIEYDMALARANALGDVLTSKAEDYQTFHQWSGFLLIGAGLTAAGIGIFDGPRSGILAAGLAGGGIASFRAFVPFAERQNIYLQGADAVACVTSSVPPPEATPTGPANVSGVVSTTAPTLQGTLSQSGGNLTALQATVGNLNQLSPTQPRLAALTTNAVLAGTVLEAVITAADDAVSEVDASVPTRSPTNTLRSATHEIKAAVNSAILDTAVDPSEALQAGLARVSGVTKETEAAVEAAKAAVKTKQNKAEETEVVADSTAAAAASTTDQASDDVEIEALQLKGVAQQTQQIAKGQLAILNRVQRLGIDCGE